MVGSWNMTQNMGCRVSPYSCTQPHGFNHRQQIITVHTRSRQAVAAQIVHAQQTKTAISRLDAEVQEERRHSCCSHAKRLLDLDHNNQHAVQAFMAHLLPDAEGGLQDSDAFPRTRVTED